MGAKNRTHPQGTFTLRNFWDIVKAIPKDKWMQLDARSFAKAVYGVDNANYGYGVRLLAKVAFACNNYEEFEHAVNSNELPTVKLDKQEMEVLKGGLMSFDWQQVKSNVQTTYNRVSSTITGLNAAFQGCFDMARDRGISFPVKEMLSGSSNLGTNGVANKPTTFKDQVSGAFNWYFSGSKSPLIL